MIAILLVGLVGLSIPAAVGAAGSGLSHHPGADLLSRRQPGCDDHLGHRAAGTPVRPDAGPEGDVVDLLGRLLGRHPAIRPQPSAWISPNRKCRRRSMPAAACCRSLLPAPPVYAKVNPADAPVITLAVSSTSLPITTVEDLADTRIAQKISQLAGVGLVSISGGQRPAVRVQANLQQLAALWPEHRRSAHHHRQQQFQRAQGQFRRRRPVLHHQRQRPAAERRRLRQHRGGLQERRAGASVRCRHRGPGRREQQTVELGQQDARGPDQCPAPARRQCHRGGGFDQGTAAPDPGRPAAPRWM